MLKHEEMFSKCEACIEVVHAGIRTSKERRGLLTPLRFFGVGSEVLGFWSQNICMREERNPLLVMLNLLTL